MRAKIVVAVSLLVALLLLAGEALAANGYEIVRNVIGGGGEHAENAPYALDGTVGQSVVGQASQTPYDLCAGFWCGMRAEYSVYLPLVLHNY
ncbi:MAG: hypothetical protein JXA14_16935 [Anaerolineae bacterium]|jgi:hypothetical protein|nr:hypothetical protein [Anaerolineae bacterium]